MSAEEIVLVWKSWSDAFKRGQEGMAFASHRSRQTVSVRQLIFALSACLAILGVTADPARAENPILSACRVSPSATLGGVRKDSPESKKAYPFILAATRFRFTGDYDHAIEQIDQAIKLDPENPGFYAARGAARRANHQLIEAMEDFDRVISSFPVPPLLFFKERRSTRA
jgi:tetratricopeptide (TPR) repeat protein